MAESYIVRKGGGGKIIVQDINGAIYEYADTVYRNDGSNNYAVQYWNLNNAATGVKLTNQAVMENQYVIGGEKDVYKIYSAGAASIPRGFYHYGNLTATTTDKSFIIDNGESIIQITGFSGTFSALVNSANNGIIGNNGIVTFFINNTTQLRRIRSNIKNNSYSNALTPYTLGSTQYARYVSDTHSVVAMTNTSNTNTRIYIYDFVNDTTEINSAKSSITFSWLLADENYVYGYRTLDASMYLYHISNGANASNYAFSGTSNAGIVKNSPYFYGIKNTGGVYTLEQFYKNNGSVFNNVVINYSNVGTLQITDTQIAAITKTAYEIYDHNLALITNGTIPFTYDKDDYILYSTQYENNQILTTVNFVDNFIAQVKIPVVNGIQGYVIKEIKK